jgi:hypothetical protein
MYLKDDFVDEYEEPDPSKKYYSRTEISYSIERRTKDGAIFIVVDKVPYHVNSEEACPSVALQFRNVESPSGLDKVYQFNIHMTHTNLHLLHDGFSCWICACFQI